MSCDKISTSNKKQGDYMTEINKRLRAAREDKDLFQKDVAEYLKVSDKQVARWEQGKSEMGIYKLKEICQLYGVSADYLLGLPPGMAWPRENRKKV